MYFLLSKILLFFVIPVNWIIILLLIAAFAEQKKLRYRTAVTGLAMLIFFSNPWIFNKVAHAWEWPPAILPANAHYSCAIILGGFISEVNEKEGRFNGSADRFIQGMRLQLTGKVSHILITGGNANVKPDQFSEGEWARGQLKQFRFVDSVVLIEGRARNTIENEKLSVILLKQRHLPPPYLLITSAFHMRRALMIFRKANVPVIPYPCDYLTGPTGSFSVINDLVPDLEKITEWDRFIKEWIGYVVNRFM